MSKAVRIMSYEEQAKAWTKNHAQLYEVLMLPIEVVRMLEENAYIGGCKNTEAYFISSYPLPEDTVLFQKGVEEGRRLEREDRKDDNLPRYYGD